MVLNDGPEQLAPIENRCAEFRRVLPQRAARCLTYALLVPFCGLLVGGLVTGLVFGVLKGVLNVGDKTAVLIGYLLGGLTWLLVLLRAYREYRVRSSDAIRLGGDRLERIA